MIRTIAVCDVCSREEELKTTPLSESSLAKELDYIGWRQRNDAVSEVCDRHPRSVVDR